jgi:hypothetical protein
LGHEAIKHSSQITPKRAERPKTFSSLHDIHLNPPITPPLK